MGPYDFLDRQVALDHDTAAPLGTELTRFLVEVLEDVYLDGLPAGVGGAGRLGLTTGSFVVDPPFFVDGDVGRVAVCGTVNSLASAGIRPQYLAMSLIIEAGLPVRLLQRVAESVRMAAREAGVKVIAVDARVVRAGDADQLFVHMTGVGTVRGQAARAAGIGPGDAIVLTAPLGGHTVHLLSIRKGLGLESLVPSDCAPLNGMLDELLDAVPGAVRAVHQVTRGGLAAVLHSCAAELGRTLRIDAGDIPVQHEARMTFDILGIDPLYSDNEGCLCLFVAAEAVEAVLDTLHGHPYGARAAVVGEVTGADGAAVLMRGTDGETTLLQAEEPTRSEPSRLR